MLPVDCEGMLPSSKPRKKHKNKDIDVCSEIPSDSTCLMLTCTVVAYCHSHLEVE